MLGLLRAPMAESRVLSLAVPTATALADRVGKNADRNCRVTWRAAKAFKSAMLICGWLRSATSWAFCRVSCGASAALAMANVNPNITAQAVRAYPRAAPEVFSLLLDRGADGLSPYPANPSFRLWTRRPHPGSRAQSGSNGRGILSLEEQAGEGRGEGGLIW